MNKTIQKANAFLLFIGGMLISTGYGATFVLDRHFKSFGGNEIDAGSILIAAMIGTFVGVPVVGWFSRVFGSANLAAAGGLFLAVGFVVLSQSVDASAFALFGGFCVGIGWGAFYLAAPMALSQRIRNEERGYWFTRFAAFQMAGIGFSPFVAGLVLDYLQFSTAQFFVGIAVCCAVAFLLVGLFEQREPLANASKAIVPWVRALPRVLSSHSRFPIVMVALGACVFSGVMTFQSSLVEGTALVPGTFFLTYAVTVVIARWMLAARITSYPQPIVVPVLLVIMISGALLVFGFDSGLPGSDRRGSTYRNWIRISLPAHPGPGS